MQQFGDKLKKTSSDTKRHFTVVMENKEHGLYVSSTPSSAAKKAVTKLCTANKSKKVEFYIREITQGSKKKTYGPYEGYIEKLKEPIELKGRVIKYKPVAKLSEKKVKKGGADNGKEAQQFKPEQLPFYRPDVDDRSYGPYFRPHPTPNELDKLIRNKQELDKLIRNKQDQLKRDPQLRFATEVNPTGPTGKAFYNHFFNLHSKNLNPNHVNPNNEMVQVRRAQPFGFTHPEVGPTGWGLAHLPPENPKNTNPNDVNSNNELYK